jgi:hypothetical protein
MSSFRKLDMGDAQMEYFSLSLFSLTSEPAVFTAILITTPDRDFILPLRQTTAWIYIDSQGFSVFIRKGFYADKMLKFDGYNRDRYN